MRRQLGTLVSKLKLFVPKRFLERYAQKKHTTKSNFNLKNSKELENNVNKRICTKCKTEYPLTNEYFQTVKTFTYKLSYFCNECNGRK